MNKFQKTTALLFILWFVLVFFLYFFTLSDNMGSDSDYLQIALEIEGHTSLQSRASAHILWLPLGKLAYHVSRLLGYTGGAVKPVEILNIFLASLGSALFLILIYELTGNLLVSIVLSLLLSFSYGLWFEFVHVKLYSGGFLFLILSFYLYMKKDVRFKPFFLSAANSLAVLFHATNLGIVICSLVYFLSSPEGLKIKLKNILLFIFGFALIGLTFYNLANIISPVYIIRSSGYLTGLTDFLLFHYNVLFLNLFNKFKIAHQSIELPHNALYFFILFYLYLFITSVKNLYKNQLFYLSLIFGILLLAAIRMTDPYNANAICFLIPCNIILGLMLKDYNRFSVLKKIIAGMFIVLLTMFMFTKNFTAVYAWKDKRADFFYNTVVENTKSFISSKDIVFSDGMPAFYLEYYTRCRVYHILHAHRDFGEEINEMGREINSHLGNSSEAKIFVLIMKNYRVRSGEISSEKFIDDILNNMSKDFDLKLTARFDDKETGNRNMVLYEIRKKL